MIEWVIGGATVVFGAVGIVILITSAMRERDRAVAEAPTKCEEEGHTNIEQKDINNYQCFRCLDCGAEEAVSPDAYHSNYFSRTQWAKGIRRAQQNAEAHRRAEALARAFHPAPPDPVAEAKHEIEEWEKEHVGDQK